jgi:hypothetical protein
MVNRQEFGKKLSFMWRPHPDNLLEKLRKTMVNHCESKPTVENLTWKITGKLFFSLRTAVV